MNAPYSRGPHRGHLIITADDFGAAAQINEAVETAHRFGILSSASLMVSGTAAADAVARARSMPGLRVGLHIVLVEGKPILPPEQIPDLVDGSGRLRNDLVRLGVEIACRPALRRQARAEIAAQFEAYGRTGLALDHVDAHKHFHLHPFVARQIIAIGRRFGLSAMRVPAEPARLLARFEQGGAPSARGLRPWTALLRAQARRAGLVTPDVVFGVGWSGAFTSKRMLKLLANLPPGLIEIYTHPATADRFDGGAPAYRYSEELAALCAPAAIAALLHSGFRLGGYADVVTPPHGCGG